MIRQEKRRLIRDAEKELAFINRHTPYLEFKNTNEFMLPKEELDQLVAQTHDNIDLQARFDLAKKIYLRVDYLNTQIEYLKSPTKTEEHPVAKSECTPHPH